jgi:hypothetical protein
MMSSYQFYYPGLCSDSPNRRDANGIHNGDPRWLLELATHVLWPSVFFSADQLLLILMLHWTLHRCRGMNAKKLVTVLQIPRNRF